jgi:hypothetical protein
MDNHTVQMLLAIAIVGSLGIVSVIAMLLPKRLRRQDN